MKRKTIQLPPKAPWEAMRIEMRDGTAHYICANGVPEQDASDLVQWARDLVDIWQEQQHICPNCRKGTNYGTDGVHCNVTGDWMSGEIDGANDKFGRDCKEFDPWPDEEFEEP
jgi:hypothetical protein